MSRAYQQDDDDEDYDDEASDDDAGPNKGLVTQSEGYELHLSDKGSTGYLGVSYRGRGKYEASRTVDGQHRLLGYFATPVAAAVAILSGYWPSGAFGAASPSTTLHTSVPRRHCHERSAPVSLSYS